MHVHKPKPVHDWREFMSEIGVIVVGILLALTAEQVIERLEANHRMHLIEAQMYSELADDDGPQAYERIAEADCANASLGRIRTDMENTASRADLLKSISVFEPAHDTWDELSYQAALSSGLEAHMNTEDHDRWAYIFSVIPRLDRTDEIETHDAADLRAISRVGGAITPEERTQVLRAVEALEIDNAAIARSAQWMVGGMERAHIKLGVIQSERMIVRAEATPMTAACLPRLRAALKRAE